MSQSNRRKFLLDSAKGLSALGITHAMSNLIIQSIVSGAKAATTSFSDKIYIFIHLKNGPPRWLFDLPLTPNGNENNFTDSFVEQGIGTYVDVVSGQSKVLYKPWRDPTSGYWLPPVWGSNPLGGSFVNCLSNAAFIRGVDFEIIGHDGSVRNQSPVIGGLSIAGVFAENTNAVFNAAISGELASTFKGTLGRAAIKYNNSSTATQNPISDLMSYFKGKTFQNTILTTQALSEYDTYSKNNQFNQKSLIDAKNKSDALVSQGVQVFTDQWAPVYAKYKIKATEALSKTANVSKLMTSAAIPRPADVNGVADGRLQVAQGASLGAFTDLKNIIIENQVVDSLAVVFATVEILASTGLTQSITTEINDYLNVAMNESQSLISVLNMDQHSVGNLVSTLGTSFYYRGILSCLEELVIVLKSKNLFNKTLIHIGSEFNRIPRPDASGSEHGPAGSGCLLISGMIKETVVVGNIKTTTTNSFYNSTWGKADKHPINESTQQTLRVNDIAKTVCGMLGISNVATNGSFILRNNGQQWERFTDARGEAKNAT